METNPGPRCPVHDVWRILCSNVRGLTGNLSDLTVASSQYEIRVGVAGSRIRSPCPVVPGQDASDPRNGCIRTK